ncbi:retropepsin-like aspartic protease [Prolixibacter sp. SD074]|jgi:hypothetical protein|uniref:retropepsin-like aspartic protease n=1 Tax=Prolixibacter sp. SD074 TaxID=2652391 RepID=UPI0012835DF1|nr:retropepsin-like aspartic protease [Prolixibacter sp. SD074]GET30819.1 hypothetical protein SD074_30210 [Prolixibacter sp. SD074]
MEIIIPIELCELEAGTYHPLVKARFGNEYVGWWVIDSGASKSVFDKSLAEHYQPDENPVKQATGLGKDLVETASGEIGELWLGQFNFGLLTIVLIDLAHINQEYARFSDKQIVGLLGSDFLIRYKAVIDYGQQQLVLKLPGMEGFA